jgi:hypothetical protein
MFSFLGSVVKAAAVVIDLPVAVVADVVTLGGALEDKDTTNTQESLQRFKKNVEDLVK